LAAGVTLTLTGSALAQEGDAAPGDDGTAPAQAPAPQVPSGGTQITVVPTQAPQTSVTHQVISPPGFPQPGVDQNAHLPSSSRPGVDTTDGFDLNRSGSGTGVVRGTGEAILLDSQSGKTQLVPNIHVVSKGDTLWDLSGRYYSNPYNWPKIWSYNPQVTNPHWIYPGDQLRMRPGGSGGQGIGQGAGSGDGSALGDPRFGGASNLPRGTVFLRDQGYIGDPQRGVWGELVGAREDQMLLSEGNEVYLMFRPGVKLKPGQELTVFRSVRGVGRVPGARKPPGEVVKIVGTVRIDHFNEKERIARGTITESLEAIERGAKIGPVRRSFDVVPPKQNRTEVWARVLSSMMPLVFMAQNQVVFLDKGSEDGLEPGNRLKILRRGDTWRRHLKTASRMARDRVRMDTRKSVDIETTPLRGDDQKFPHEVVGELRVLRTEKYSSIALVTDSRRELVAGDRALAQQGY
jgi:hypothetical protein